ncbi:MAG TPA: GntR family transcriptional regulator [Bradyrhizobium sp.]
MSGEVLERNLEHLRAEFAHAEAPDVPKHVRLRNAVLSAIRKGHFRPGDQLPPEQELSKAVGVSLGTVQRALTRLAADRALTREHGRGTFIARSELPAEDLWQFRFVEKIGQVPLPVSVEFVDRRLVRGPGPWADALGPDEKGYCELTRNVTVNSDYRCLSRLYARLGRFPKIMKLPQSKMAGNLKRVLAEEFGVPTLSLDQFILPCVLDDEVCASLKVDRGSAGMVVNAIARSIGQEIITFQSLWVPAGTYFLEISPSGHRPPMGRLEKH